MQTSELMTISERTLFMKTKQLGNSDLFITPVGYGSWAIGGAGWQFGWGKQNDDDSVAAIHRALELGVNWIDTAAVYGLGHSEEIVARALASWTGPRPVRLHQMRLEMGRAGPDWSRVDAEFHTSRMREQPAPAQRGRPSTSIRSTGRWRTRSNLKPVGRPWRTCSGKAKSAGSVFRISMWTK